MGINNKSELVISCIRVTRLQKFLRIQSQFSAIFIGLLSTICSSSFILIDALTSKTTIHERCTLSNDPSNNYETASITLLIAQLSISNVTEVCIMIAGLILYFLTTRRCCSTLTRDVKISIALNSTIGFNTGIIVILYILQVSADVSYSCSTVGTIIEQVSLFIVFFTANKVLSQFQCTHSNYDHPLP